MRRTRAGVFLRALAAARPPKPPPTMTTRGARSSMGLIRLGVGLGLHTQSADGRAEHQETCPRSDDLPAFPHAPPPSPHGPASVAGHLFVRWGLGRIGCAQESQLGWRHVSARTRHTLPRPCAMTGTSVACLLKIGERAARN